MHATHRRTIALLAVPAVLVATTGIVLLVLRPDLPDPVAVHFGPGGAADGFASPTSLAVTTLGIQAAVGALLAAMVAAAGRQVAGGRAMLGLPSGVVAFVGAIAVATAWSQRGLDDATLASLGTGALGIALLVGVAGGVVGAVLAPPPTAVPAASGGAPVGAPRTAIGDGTAVWRGTTRANRVLPAVAGAGLGLGLVPLWLLGPWLLVPALVVAAALVASVRFTVTVGSGGVVVRGLLGWPRVTVPLAQVTGADVEHVRPLAWGGWGWRARPGRTGVITSAGPGLVVRRADGASLVVTVTEAEEAAGVVNELVDRREATRAARAS